MDTYIGSSGRVYASRSFGCLAASNPLRRLFISFIEWKWFDRVVLLLICLNCAFLAVQGPPDSPSAVFAPARAGRIEITFTVLFTIEMLCKWVALGVAFHRGAYVRDPWNLLDMTVVTAGWAPLIFPGLDNLSAIRSVRALRPLRSVQRLPGLRRQVATMLNSLPKLADVALLGAFILLVYGVLGVQLFKGTLLYRCYESADAPGPIDAEGGVCAPTGDDLLRGGAGEALAAPAESAGGENGCGAGEACRFYGVDPVYGTISFDSIGWAWMTLFQCITMEGWVDVLYMEMATLSPAVAVVYFVSLVMLGSFYLLNLFLAVLYETYLDEQEAKEEAAELAAEAEEEAAAAAKARLSAREAEEAALLARRSEAAAAAAAARASELEAAAAASRGCVASLCARVVDAPCFTPFITALIVLNTALMMCEHHGMSAQLADLLEDANLVLTGCFAGEMALKLLGHGARRYWADSFNRFDAVVVVSSLLEVAMTYLKLELGLNPSFLRAFRLMRVFKLARSWGGLRSILACVLRSIEPVSQLLALFALILFIFGLLGVQLFGLKFTPEAGFDEVPRTNYDTTSEAVLTVFVVMSGENWNDVWADTKLAVGAWCAGYYVLMVVIGNYVVLNLFVAILLSGLEADDEDDVARHKRLDEQATRLTDDSASRGATAQMSLLLSRMDREGQGPAQAPPPGHEKGVRRCLWERRHHALLLLGPGHPLRRLCLGVIHCKVPCLTVLSFDNLIIAVILASSICMAFESCDLDPSSRLARDLEQVNLASTCIFVAEMLCKILALGLLFTEGAYLSTGWNRLDCFIVLSSLLTLVGGGSPAIRVLRVLRVLRPLRLISKFGGMRLVISLLIRTLPKVINVLVVSFFILLIFGILGVQLFAGRFASCEGADDAVGTLTLAGASESGAEIVFEGVGAAHLDRAACEAAGGVWANPPLGSFDNIFAAALLLFEMAGMEGWPDVMYAGIDAVAVDRAPVRNANIGAALFFILWIVLGGMFVVNLFVGVIVDTYTDVKEEEDGSKLMDESQRQWVQVMSQVVSVRPRRTPPPPQNPLRRACHVLITASVFEPAVLCVILFNTALIALDDYDVGPTEARYLSDFNIACTCIFTLEAALKNVALGPREYFTSGWNLFDFAVVALALPDLLVGFGVIGSAVDSPLPPTLLRALRIVRVARVLRTIKSSKGLRSLLSALLLSLPAMGNLTGIFVIVQFLYSVLGMQIFGRVAWGDFLNADANFCSFGVAFLTMFRCATGESWNGLMHDCMVTPATPQGAGCSYEAGDCGSWLAVPFFLSYTVVASFVALNMMIAVVLENFALSRASSDYRLSPEHSEAFLVAWGHYDPFATGFIGKEDLGGLLEKLPPPLNVPFLAIPMEDTPAPGTEQKLSFQSVNMALLHEVYGDVIDRPGAQGFSPGSRYSADKALHWRRINTKAALIVQRVWRRGSKAGRARAKMHIKAKRYVEGKLQSLAGSFGTKERAGLSDSRRESYPDSHTARDAASLRLVARWKTAASTLTDEERALINSRWQQSQRYRRGGSSRSPTLRLRLPAAPFGAAEIAGDRHSAPEASNQNRARLAAAAAAAARGGTGAGDAPAASTGSAPPERSRPQKPPTPTLPKPSKAAAARQRERNAARQADQTRQRSATLPERQSPSRTSGADKLGGFVERLADAIPNIPSGCISARAKEDAGALQKPKALV